tara:strand:+ start:43 stop:975 length:933 start_codon:yes stop_codon:yes gene_type:complete
MHKALREVLGDHVIQKGSLVNQERTRFDFAHNAPVTDEEIRTIELLVNSEILTNQLAQARVMDLDSAHKTGAMMLFGEKYGETVRVLDIGSSRELCGGTHVQRTGDIGFFKIVSEAGVASGVRRIEAVTGEYAVKYIQDLNATITKVSGVLKTPVGELDARAHQLVEQNKLLEKEVAVLKNKLAAGQGAQLISQVEVISDSNGHKINILSVKLDGGDGSILKDTLQRIKDKLHSAVIVLGSVDGDKVQIAAGVTSDLLGKIKAGELVNYVAAQVGGKGGGKADVAMAGGTDPGKLDLALASVKGWVAKKV